MVGLLEALVRSESPSRDKSALDQLGARLASSLGTVGGLVEVIRNNHGGNHILARFAGADPERPALILGHFDTVWPLGTLERMPFRVEDGARLRAGYL